MNLYAVKETSLHETDGISFNVYFSGCHGYCDGCHSDHTWDFNSGSKLVVDDFVKYMKEIKSFTFDNICILGGEPLDQPTDELVVFFKTLKENFPSKPLWLYTHFELDEVPMEILETIDYIKTGKYEKDLPEATEQFGVFLASCNQVVHKMKKNNLK